VRSGQVMGQRVFIAKQVVGRVVGEVDWKGACVARVCEAHGVSPWRKGAGY